MVGRATWQDECIVYDEPSLDHQTTKCEKYYNSRNFKKGSMRTFDSTKPNDFVQLNSFGRAHGREYGIKYQLPDKK